MTIKDMIMYGWMALITVLLVVGMVGGDNQPSVGGSTSSNWNIGGNLSVTGTTALTGALTSTGALAVTGETTLQGVLTRYQTQALDTATTTVCSLQSPSATSTLESGAITLDVSSTTASTITIAKAATAFATTTLIRSASVSANAQATIIAASTTLSALEQTNRIFGPSEWLVVGMAGGTGTFSPTGDCWANWTTGN